jgi:DNA-binding transcriptional regulator GbsR (MarR family)
MNYLDAPVLPYNGTSGWSGTDTSKERAEVQDKSGETARVQMYMQGALWMAGEHGLTWKEIAEETHWHHGTVSGALSVLHKEGKISRLLEKRNRCRVYVLNEYVSGRETDSQGRKPKECPNCGHSL